MAGTSTGIGITNGLPLADHQLTLVLKTSEVRTHSSNFDVHIADPAAL